MVLGVCNDILCKSLNALTVQEKDILLGALSQYTAMKQQYIQMGEPVSIGKAIKKER